MSHLFYSATWNAIWNSTSTIKENEKFWIFWAHKLINTHHNSLHVVFTGSSEWMNYTYNLRLGSTYFPKTVRPFQKLWIQKSDIKEVQNLKYTHCLRFVVHMIWKYLEYVCHLTQSCKWLSSLGTLEMQRSQAFWRLCTLKSNSVIVERIKHDYLSVSKFVAW